MRSVVARIVGVLVAAPLAGCEAPMPVQDVAAPQPSVDLSELFATRRAAQAASDPDAVPTHLNTPRAAAQELAIRGRWIEQAAQRHVGLHAALYRAAIDSVQTGHPAYLLNPSNEVDDARPGEMSGTEFRLRVLARLANVDQPVMWDAPQLTWMFDERSPGGPAALAWFEIVSEHPELATVEADVCLESPDIGTRKRRVEAIYDGRHWNIRNLGVQTTW